MEHLKKRVREKQREMDSQYILKTVHGSKYNIPWTGHMPIRIIVNRPQKKAYKNIPAFIHLHGGGFIEGDAVTMDSFCQNLADTLGILVVNISYRLAPDFIFPYQIQEIKRVYEYLLANASDLGINTERIAIGGFSAGALLAIGTVIQDILSGGNSYRCCVCGYPLTSALKEDIDQNSVYDTLDANMADMMSYYYHGEEKNILNSPLYASEKTLEKMPACIILTCGKDSLGNMGKRFTQRLIQCGVPVYFKEFKEAYHGFIEVNRPDYFLPDNRKNDKQKMLTNLAEKFIIEGLSIML